MATCAPPARAVVVCYFTRDPRSTSISAKAHGRVSLAVKALELSLSVVYALNKTFGAYSRLVSVARGRGCVTRASAFTNGVSVPM